MKKNQPSYDDWYPGVASPRNPYRVGYSPTMRRTFSEQRSENASGGRVIRSGPPPPLPDVHHRWALSEAT